MKKISNFILNLSLRTKLLLSSCVCFILLFSVCSTVGLQIVDRNNRSLLTRTLATGIDLSTGIISDALQDIEQLTYQILANSVIQDQLSNVYYSDPGSEERNLTVGAASDAVYSELISLQNQNSEYISYIVMVTDAFTSRTSFQASEELDADALTQIVSRAESKEGSPVWVKGRSERLVVAREIREIRETRFTNLGTVIIGVDVESLIRDTTSRAFDSSTCLLYFGTELLYVPEGLTLADTIRLQMSLSDITPGSYRIIEFQNISYFAVSGDVPDYPQWSYITLVSYQDYADSIRLSSAFYYVIIGVSLLLSLLLNMLMLNRITHDLDNLVLKMKHFHGQEDTGSTSEEDYSSRTDELGLLHQEFDSMAAEIRQLIHVNYTNELLMKDAQLKALEMQINPHFLYNTLESINWRAKAGGATEISQMVEALGNLLRKTLSRQSERNTLREEMEVVRYFMTIMDLRFEDRLQYTISADPELLNAELPALTIQPLVENAANYALEEMTELCYIDIKATKTADRPHDFTILVRNTGTRFEEHLLEKLKTAQVKPRGLGIGLLNIEKRLRLTFGEDFQLDFYNEDGFAVARIILPYRPTGVTRR